MKESLRHIDKRIIFKETFQSEQNTRRLGGVPTDVDYSNGIGSFDIAGNQIEKEINLNGTYSVRIILKNYTYGAFQYILSSELASALNVYIRGDLSGDIQYPSGTVYVNGITSVTPESNMELVISGMTFNSTKLFIGNFISGTTNSMIGDYELIEIYKGTLTAEEVSNLYENKTYHELPDKIDENTYKILDVVAFGGVLENKFSGGLVGDDELDDGGNWTIVSGTPVINGNIITFNDAGASDVNRLNTLEANKQYLIEVEVSDLIAGSGIIPVFQIGVVDINGNSIIITENGTYSYIYETTTTNCYMYCYAGSSGTIEVLRIQEIVPELVNTDIDIKKVGSNMWSPDFNALTSKIDCGNYDDLTGDITILAWINTRSMGEGAQGRIIAGSDSGADEGLIWSVIDTNRMQCFNGVGGTSKYSATNSIELNKWQLVTLKRKANGDATFYVDSVISGIENQNAGTPSGISSNIIIGNTPSKARTFDGKILRTVIYLGLLSTKQITQFWSNTRRYYE